MHRWRYPSLSLHGIEGAFSGSGAKTVIPRKVVGKFSIRLVPNMTPEVVSEQARRHGGARRAAVPEEMVTEGPRGPPPPPRQGRVLSSPTQPHPWRSPAQPSLE